MYTQTRMAGRPPKSPQDVLVNIGVRVPAQFKKQLERMSKENGVANLAEFLRRLVAIGAASYGQADDETRALLSAWSDLNQRQRGIVLQLARMLPDRAAPTIGKFTERPEEHPRHLDIAAHGPTPTDEETTELITKDVERMREVVKPKKH